MIRDMALEQKKDEVISEWINSSLLKTYVRINEAYKVLDFQYNWLKKLIMVAKNDEVLQLIN